MSLTYGVQGVYYGIREFLKHGVQGLTPGLKGKTCVVQGFGNVGSWASKFLQEDGAKVIAVIEYNGAVFNSKGLDIEALIAYHAKHKTLMGFPGAERQVEDGRSFLELECDILVPGAMEKTIHKENAPRLRCKVVAEAANGPVTPFADDILRSKGIIIIPDLLLNAGGVTVSYFEWLKNISHVRFGRLTKKWEEGSKTRLLDEMQIETGKTITEKARQAIVKGPDERDIVYSGLEETMITACQQTVDTARELNVTYRTAAYVNALRKIHVCYKDAGIIFA